MSDFPDRCARDRPFKLLSNEPRTCELTDSPHDRTKYVPCKCPVCERCRYYVAGARKGMCLSGGPFKGYIEV